MKNCGARFDLFLVVLCVRVYVCEEVSRSRLYRRSPSGFTDTPLIRVCVCVFVCVCICGCVCESLLAEH